MPAHHLIMVLDVGPDRVDGWIEDQLLLIIRGGDGVPDIQRAELIQALVPGGTQIDGDIDFIRFILIDKCMGGTALVGVQGL